MHDFDELVVELNKFKKGFDPEIAYSALYDSYCNMISN